MDKSTLAFLGGLALGAVAVSMYYEYKSSSVTKN